MAGLKFKLDPQHEYEDSIKMDILAEEHVPGNGVQQVIAASFFMTKEQFIGLVEDGSEWFNQGSSGYET